MRFKAVIFDLGDTLVLTDRWDYDKCLTKLLKSLQNDNVAVSISLEEFRQVYFEVRNQMYLELDESLKEVDFQLRIVRTLRKFGFKMNRESSIILRAIESFVDTFIEDLRMEKWIPGLLNDLRKKYKVGLVSNFAFAAGVWLILEHFAITKFFDAVVISGELGLRKPHPKIFEEALSRLDVEAREAVFVGDSLKADINGAKKLGLKAILVENVGLRKNPYAVAGELDPYPVNPDLKVPNLKELPRILESL